MKLKFIAVAVAAIAAQSAFALTPLQTKAVQINFQNGVANNHVVYLSGASALAKSVPGALAKLCSDSVTTFTNADSNIKAYSCTVGGAVPVAGMAVGSKLLVGLSVSEGSFSGVLSQNATNFTYDIGAGVKNVQNNQIDFSAVASDAATLIPAVFRKQTAGGFLDVEPRLFDDLVSNPALAALNVSYTTTPVAAGQSFGVAVSPALYAALQVAQGITCAAGDYSVACQPSISKGQYASLVAQSNAGFIADWSVLGLSDAQPVNLCRRVATSGTQAASNAFFLGKGCSSAAFDPSAAADQNAGTFNIVENSGSSNVATCLSNASNFAIGVISAENALATTTWKFVKLDGVAVWDGVKARQNTIDQKYDFAFEFVTATRNSASAASQGLIAALGTAIADPLVTDLTGIFIVPGAAGINADAPGKIAKATTGGNSCAAPLYYF
ncbi:hypothetical protein GCM10027046_09150 [Uliginosibacterium flavum]|uniref:PBP domain-containing protein n=1 Tax=Uliginosibacterium flavum TaxID=1396831 RepID=A0ABV2TI97_9RHOO